MNKLLKCLDATMEALIDGVDFCLIPENHIALLSLYNVITTYCDVPYNHVAMVKQ